MALLRYLKGDQWIRSWALEQEVSGSNPIATQVVPMGKTLYPHCIVPRIGFKPSVPLLLTPKQLLL